MVHADCVAPSRSLDQDEREHGAARGRAGEGRSGPVGAGAAAWGYKLLLQLLAGGGQQGSDCGLSVEAQGPEEITHERSAREARSSVENRVKNASNGTENGKIFASGGAPQAGGAQVFCALKNQILR